MTRWAEQVAATGYCTHPVRLRGRVEHADPQTGEVRTVYSTDREPDATLLKACGNRRASVCPSCSATYQADSFQLLAAGLRGGKGVPETVTAHPRLFVTFTAPSFGRVHSRKAQGRLVYPCHPFRQGQRCPHGEPGGLLAAPRRGRPQVGGAAVCPLLPDRRPSPLERPGRAAVVADHHLPVSGAGPARRACPRPNCGGWCASRSPRWPSTRSGARSTSTPSSAWTPPPTAAARPVWPRRRPGSPPSCSSAAVRQAAATVAVPCPALDEDQGVTLVARWGEQLDVHPITEAGDEGELSAEQVAGYVAKYATKSTEALGVTLDHRVCEVELEGLDVPAHVAELVRACWELGGPPWAWEAAAAQVGAHASASAATSRPRAAATPPPWGRCVGPELPMPSAAAVGDALPLDAWGRPEDDQAVIVVASWHYLGSGYQTTGEAWLAASAAARAREARRVAREELRSTTTAA